MNQNDEYLSALYEIDDCVDWLLANNFRSTCLQFSDHCLPHSSALTLILKKRTDGATDFHISNSTMCSVDYLSIQHLNQLTVDSVIHFGKVCLTESKFSESLPVLYVFGKKGEPTLSLDISSDIYSVLSVKPTVIRLHYSINR